MNYKEILAIAGKSLKELNGQTLDVLDVKKPNSISYAKHLAKVISKISPLIGNMIEYYVVELLNKEDWQNIGIWQRQDPGFPDAIFKSSIDPMPGIEIKTWFPLATEITARFKDSVLHFDKEQTDLALIAWLPENIIYGKPKIIDVWVGSAKSVAEARDKHYHRPPDYLVFEPEDTSDRTSNLQQTNTNGYKFQGNKRDFELASQDVEEWGINGKIFSPNDNYQKKLKELLGKYSYRLDTNFAKIDRIEHEGIEGFKTKVLNTVIDGNSIKSWSNLINSDESVIEKMVKSLI